MEEESPRKRTFLLPVSASIMPAGTISPVQYLTDVFLSDVLFSLEPNCVSSTVHACVLKAENTCEAACNKYVQKWKNGQ